ncbi:MAG TPA: tetratricopeptide repeat protein [Candidatus Manganitrophaceae bacterium]|nr:tetratricopeptide repeat protein [Candidatus Manganitrophaceae bacterium]
MLDLNARTLPALLFFTIFFLFLFPPFQFNSYSEEFPADLFDRGVRALQEGDLKSAEAFFQSVLKEDPENPFAYFNLGNIFFATRRVDLALTVLSRAVELKPDLMVAHLRLGEIYERQGNLAEAIREFEEAYLYLTDENSPEGARVLSRLEALQEGVALREHWGAGLDFLKKGDFKAAEGAFREILAWQPQNAKALNYLGIVLGIQNRFEEAIDIFKESLRLEPDLLDSRIRLAELYEMKGASAESRSELERALFLLEDKDGEEAQSLDERLNAIDERIELKDILTQSEKEIAEKNIDAAIATLQEGARLFPKSAIAYFNLGNLWGQKNRLDLAESAFKRAIENEPNYTEAYQRLGQVYELYRFWGRARRQYEKALATPGGGASTVKEELQKVIGRIDQIIKQAEAASQSSFAEGQKALKGNDLDRAISFLEQAVFSNPEDPQLHLRLGALYEDKDQIDLAMNEMRGALEFHPRLAKPHQRLGALYEKKGYYYQARKEWKEAESISPSDENKAGLSAVERKLADIENETLPLIEKAEKEAEEGEAQKAIETLKKGLAPAPDDVRIRMMLGMLFAQTAAQGAAYSEFSAVLSLDPSNGEAHYRLGDLYASAKQWEDARREYEAAFQSKNLTEERRMKTSEGLARAIARLNNEKEAKRYFDRGARFLTEEDYGAAIENFEKVIRLYPEYVPGLYGIGVSYESLGNQAEAFRYYRKVLSISDGHVQARKRLGLLYEREGKIEDAAQSYREALSSLGGEASPDAIWLKERLNPLEKKLFVSVSQAAFSYDSNPTGSSNPEADLSSNLGVSLNYYLKREQRLQIPIGLSTQNTFYFRSNAMFSNEVFSVSAASFQRPFFYSLGYNAGLGLARGGATGLNQAGLLSFIRRGSAPTAVGFDYRYDNFISFGSKIFDAVRQSARMSVTQDWDLNSAVFSYRLFDNDAELSDQAYRSHTVGMIYSRNLSSDVKGDVSYHLEWKEYRNPDSFNSSVQQRPVFRKNILQSLGLGATYSLQENLTLGISYSRIRSHSNLPAATAVTAEQRLSGQAEALGNFSQHFMTLSLNWSF